MTQTSNNTVKIVWRGADRFDIHIRRHAIRVDQPTDFGGSDTGPIPAELLVGSLAASVAQCAERYLHRCQLPAGVTVTAHFTMGLRPAHISRIDLVIDAPGVPRGLRTSFATALEHSVAYNSLRTPPEITFQIHTEADMNRTISQRAISD